jgi:hypothetical protein
VRKEKLKIRWRAAAEENQRNRIPMVVVVAAAKGHGDRGDFGTADGRRVYAHLDQHRTRVPLWDVSGCISKDHGAVQGFLYM